MKSNHIPGHLQALVKNKICTAVLSFPEHDYEKILSTASNFEYDGFIDLCRIKTEANIGDAWNGKMFKTKPYDSWTLDQDGNWQAPTPQEDINHIWYEEHQLWANPPTSDEEDSTNTNRQ
jgi:hypothetical protein